jgi:TRAP-type uncharacterized transport system fused permease subunit
MQIHTNANLSISSKQSFMKLKNIVFRTVFYIVPIFLLDLYLTPERSLNEKLAYLIGLTLIGIIVAIFGTWIEMKYPYQSSYQPKNEPNLEKNLKK